MTESNIAVTAGSGESVDTFTLAGGNKRQSVVVGDSSIGGNVAPVQQTDPASDSQGLVVRDVNTSAIVAKLTSGVTVTPSTTGTMAVYFDKSNPSVNVGTPTITGITNSINAYIGATAGTINVQLKPGTIAVFLDPGHLLGSVTSNVGTGTMAVFFDQSNPSVNVGTPTITGITNSVSVYVSATAGTINVQLKPGTIAVSLDPGHLLGSVTANAGTGTMTVVFDPGHELGSIKGTNSSLAVFLDPGHLLGSVTANAGTGTFTVTFDPGHELGTIKGNSNTLTVFLPDTGHTLGKVDAGAGTFNVQLDPGHTLGNIATVAAVTNITNSISTYISATAGTMAVNVGTVSGSIAVFFSPSNPSVNATFSSASMEVVPTTGSRKTMDDAHAAQRVLIVGSQTNSSLQIIGITNSISTYISGTAGSLGVRVGQVDGTVAVYFSPANPTVNATFAPSGTLAFAPITGSSHPMWEENYNAQRIFFAGSNPNSSLVVNAGTGSFTVQFDPGHELGSVKGITNSINVYIGATAGTMAVNVGKVDGTVAVFFSPGTPAVNNAQWMGSTAPTVGSKTSANSIPVVVASDQGTITVKLDPAGTVNANVYATANIFSISGSTSGVSVSGVQLVAPSANASFKVFAFSLQTTGVVSLVARFTNGAGTSPTEYFRGLVTANQTSSTPVGANLAVQPPGFLFATGVSTTLALLLDTASLVHYSVSYIKESA